MNYQLFVCGIVFLTCFYPCTMKGAKSDWEPCKVFKIPVNTSKGTQKSLSYFVSDNSVFIINELPVFLSFLSLG